MEYVILLVVIVHVDLVGLVTLVKQCVKLEHGDLIVNWNVIVIKMNFVIVLMDGVGVNRDSMVFHVKIFVRKDFTEQVVRRRVIVKIHWNVIM